MEELYKKDDEPQFERECEKCETVVCFRLKSGHYTRISEKLDHQSGRSKKYEGEIASYCLEHKNEKMSPKIQVGPYR